MPETADLLEEISTLKAMLTASEAHTRLIGVGSMPNAYCRASAASFRSMAMPDTTG